jgi:hypothetical protein
MSLSWRNRSPFFNLSLWSFCLRSVFKEYGNAFIFEVVLLHPLKTLKGVQKYGQLSARNSSTGCMISPKKSEPSWRGGKGSVVGIGFCAKPMEPSCISERANHNCAYFEHHLQLSKDTMPTPCQNCLVREIGLEAISSKSDFYIMTSAKDILSDLFLPALNSNTYTTALLGLCHYSFEPFKIALFISGIDTFLFPFEEGDCEDYKTWRQADKGIKETQTQLKDCDLDTIKALLENSTHKPEAGLKFTKKGNIFRFDA